MSNKNIFGAKKLAILAVLIFALGCSAPLRLAAPFPVKDIPQGWNRAPATVFIILDRDLVKPSGELDQESAKQLNSALFEGVRQASALLFENVRIVERKPEGGCDFLIQPANLFLEIEGGASVGMSMDVTVVRVRDSKEIGMLVEGAGHPGPRPTAFLEKEAGKLQVSGPVLKNGPLGQGLNNALFNLTFDFLKKLDRRMETLR
jgi:hypothetical protein